MKKWLWLVGILAVGLTGVARAETDFLEAGPPPGWLAQLYQIYFHADDFSRDDIPIDGFDLDAYNALLRVAYFDKAGPLVHTIIPFTYIDEDVRINAGGSRLKFFGDSDAGLGDIFVGGGWRWINEDKDLFFIAGGDLRLPTGEFSNHADASSPAFVPFRDAVNIGSGSLSAQPFVILTKLWDKGRWASDTELRYDVNTSAGPINYNPDDKLEVWQNISYGLTPHLRVGPMFKGEFEIEDADGDHDHSVFTAVGPGVFWSRDQWALWGKVLFDVYSADAPEDTILLYLRLSYHF